MQVFKTQTSIFFGLDTFFQVIKDWAPVQVSSVAQKKTRQKASNCLSTFLEIEKTDMK